MRKHHLLAPVPISVTHPTGLLEPNFILLLFHHRPGP